MKEMESDWRKTHAGWWRIEEAERKRNRWSDRRQKDI